MRQFVFDVFDAKKYHWAVNDPKEYIRLNLLLGRGISEIVHDIPLVNALTNEKESPEIGAVEMDRIFNELFDAIGQPTARGSITIDIPKAKYCVHYKYPAPGMNAEQPIQVNMELLDLLDKAFCCDVIGFYDKSTGDTWMDKSTLPKELSEIEGLEQFICDTLRLDMENL